MKPVRSLLVVSSLAVWMAPGAAAQTYSFTSCNSQATATIVVTGNLTNTPPVTSGGLTTYTYLFTGSFSLNVGGTTTTTTGLGEIVVAFGSIGNGTITALTFGTPPNPTTFLPGWAVYLQASGTLLTPGVFPATIPPLSAWTEQGVGMSYDYISLNGSTPSYYFSCSATGPSGATGPTGPTGATGASGATGAEGSAPGDTLGDPSDQPCPVCPHPIDLGTGNMFERADDYHTFEANPLSFTRYYNSMTAAPTLAVSLGPNWRSNYDRYLQISTSTVIAERADGRQVTFTLNGASWTTETDIDLSLVNSGSTWTLTDHHDNVETYTAVNASEAMLQTIQTRNGYTQTLQYNSNNQVVSVTDSYGHQLMFTYNNSLLQSVTTPDGLVLTYGFTPTGGSNVLTSISYSTTPVTTKSYLYEKSSLPFALTGIVDENANRYMSWTYDSEGRALTSQLAGGAGLTTIVYNDSDGSRMVTNAVGEQVLYKFTTLQGVPKVIEADRIAGAGIAAATRVFTYDSNGYIASATDWNGNETTFVNNARGEPLTINEAVGTSQARTTNITYHSIFRLPLQITSPGVTVNFTYDAAGELLTDTLTDTTTSSVPYSTGGQTRTWKFAWSNFLISSIQGPRTDVPQVTSVSYDSSGTLTSVTNALQQTLQITRHLPGGLPQTIVNSNGVTANFTYDARQRLLSSALTTSAGVLTTAFSYDAAGNLLSKTLPDGSSFTNTYDAAHRFTGLADNLGNSIELTLDALGDRTAVTAAGSGSAPLKRSAAFDGLGRILKLIGGANQTISLAYDSNGNVQTVTDPLGHVVQQSFDALNREVKAVDPADGIKTVSYDAHDRPVSITDANGAATTYIYDGFGDLIQQLSPAAGTMTYRTDAAGEIVQEIDARGVVTNVAYDALGRPISVSYPGSPAENVTFTYDEPDHGFGIGRLTSVTDASGSLSRSYDERGNLLSEARTYSNTTLVVSYTYDSASRLASITYPSRWSIQYTRDSIGRITGIAAQSPTGASQSLVSSVTYLPFGPLTALTYGNGIAEKRSFDADDRITGIVSSNIQNLAYSYNANNNVLGVADSMNSANSQSFGYDSLNRLMSATGSYGKLAYTYDANGNRTSETSPATSDGINSVAALTYNQAGSLAAVFSANQQLTQYTYDAFGKRLLKTGSVTGTTLYQYDPDGRLLEEADGQGNAQVDYIYLNDRAIATIEANGSVYFLHDDRLGTPLAATSATQSVAWSTTYSPFGQIGSAPTQIVEDLRLPGQESDLETGLYNNGFRDYVPGWGAYVASDPIGLMGGMNTYGYGSANPLRYTDRFGLDCALAHLPTSSQILAATGSVDAANLWSQALQWNSTLAGAESTAANAVVDGLSLLDWAVASTESDALDTAINRVSLWNSDIMNAASLAADEYAHLAEVYASGSSTFGDLGIKFDAVYFPNTADLILNSQDVSWELLLNAGLTDIKSTDADIARNVTTGTLAALGVAAEVGEAKPGQGPITFVVAGSATALGYAAAALAGAAERSVLVTVGIGYGVTKTFEALGQAVFPGARPQQ